MPVSWMIQPTVAAIATRPCLSSAARNHASVRSEPYSAMPAGSQYPSGAGGGGRGRHEAGRDTREQSQHNSPH